MPSASNGRVYAQHMRLCRGCSWPSVCERGVLVPLLSLYLFCLVLEPEIMTCYRLSRHTRMRRLLVTSYFAMILAALAIAKTQRATSGYTARAGRCPQPGFAARRSAPSPQPSSRSRGSRRRGAFRAQAQCAAGPQSPGQAPMTPLAAAAVCGPLPPLPVPPLFFDRRSATLTDDTASVCSILCEQPSDNIVAGPAAVAVGRTPYHCRRWPVSDLLSSSSSRLLKLTRCSVSAGMFSGQGASLDGSSGAVGSGSTQGGDGALGVSPWGRAVYGASPGAATLPVLCFANIGVLNMPSVWDTQVIRLITTLCLFARRYQDELRVC